MRLQAPCTATLRPAQWTSSCTTRTWSKVIMQLSFKSGGKMEAPTAQTVIKALAFLEADGRNFMIRRNDGRTFVAYFVTPYYQWIDLVRASFERVDEGGESFLQATFTSQSTAAFPSSCIGAPCMSCCFGCACPCIFIEDGDGKNLQHLMQIVDVLGEQGLTIAHEIQVWGAADQATSKYAPTKESIERSADGPALAATAGSFA